MGEAFTDTPRVGPYVGDIALGDRLLAEVRARQTPLFLFCVTMENHGPWKPGRLPDIDDPQAQYLHHVANTGQMVEDIVAGLDVIARERHQTITLCVFGDHAPSLPSCKPGFGGRTTDYALFRFGQPQALRLRSTSPPTSSGGRCGGFSRAHRRTWLPGHDKVKLARHKRGCATLVTHCPRIARPSARRPPVRRGR